MKCQKCGESLHPEQKACLACGTPTNNWPGGKPVEEEEPKEIPWLPIGIIGGGLLVVIILIAVGLHLRVVPPDRVVKNWVDAIASRAVNKAKDYTTENFESLNMDQPMSARKSDEYYDFIYNNEGTYTVSAPKFSGPTSAEVTVICSGRQNQKMEDHFALVRQGRKWKIDGFTR